MTDIVPTIDISGWAGGGAAARHAIAAAFDDACRRIGFVQLVGHGLDAALCAELRRVADAFFDLPLADKLRARPPRAEINRGYTAEGSESLAYSLGVDAQPDLFEAFNIGVGAPPRPSDDPVVFAPNIWPDEPATMRAVFEEYFAVADALAHRLTTIAAVALELDADFFADKTDCSVNVLRANHYCCRAGSPPPAPNQMRMGAHTDYGILTVLLADPVPGLQIVGPDGAWHDVLPIDGGVVVNLGDAVSIWTNDRWRSTLHRVVPPPPGTAAGVARRRSFAFFHDGNADAVMSCLPTCCTADDPPRYAPIALGEHVRDKLLGPRTLRRSQATQTVGDRRRAVAE